MRVCVILCRRYFGQDRPPVPRRLSAKSPARSAVLCSAPAGRPRWAWRQGARQRAAPQRGPGGTQRGAQRGWLGPADGSQRNANQRVIFAAREKGTSQ